MVAQTSLCFSLASKQSFLRLTPSYNTWPLNSHREIHGGSPSPTLLAHTHPITAAGAAGLWHGSSPYFQSLHAFRAFCSHGPP